MNNNHSSWWRTAAVHIWRNFYRRIAEGVTASTIEQTHCDELCRHSLAEFEQWQRDFLQEYFSCPWGQDLETLLAYTDRTGRLENHCWQTIHTANRRIFELAGLLEPKGRK